MTEITLTSSAYSSNVRYYTQIACVTILFGNPLIENVDFIESKPIQDLTPVCWHPASKGILRKEGTT